jgi:hypothetical protein
MKKKGKGGQAAQRQTSKMENKEKVWKDIQLDNCR